MASIDNGSDLGIEASLFKTADKLRGNMEPSDYKHVALGLIFLKHISDGFELKRQTLLAEYPDDAEDPDAYLAENVFWVPQDARWSHLQASAKQPTIGRLIDEAIFHLFFIRNIHSTSLTWAAARGTRVVWTVVIIITAAQFAVTYLVPLQSVLGTRPVPLMDGLLIVAIGAAFFALIEIEKQIRLGLKG